MDNAQRTSASFLKTSFLEALIIILLVTITLITLNYFNIVPLSSSFSILSFLPRTGVPTTTPSTISQIQNIQLKTNNTIQSAPSTNNNLELKQVVPAVQPKVSTNSGTASKYDYIKNSEVQPTGELRIDVELSVKGRTPEDEKDQSGFLLSNGGREKIDLRFIELIYMKGGWSLAYHHAEKADHTYLAPLSTTTGYGRFVMLIPADGKNVTVYLPDRQKKTIQLADSLYTSGNKMSSLLHIAPGAEVQLHTLNYQLTR